jgi:crotonobetainyl-CoA:carnitine CoA-transferase CaiB-like acyl-CoA transferase
MVDKPKDTSLTGYRILDLADEKGKLCAKILANMGAEVIRVNPEDKNKLLQFIKNTDVIIETFPPGYLKSHGLSYDTLSKLNPRLIMVSITHFGQNGPYKNLKSCDLVNQALGGWLSVTGEPAKPLKLFGNQSYNTVSLFAVNGILLALRQRRVTGRGQHLDISIMECVLATLDYVLPRYFYEGIVSKRQGTRHWNNAFRIFPCKDGYILLTIHPQWDTLLELMVAEGAAGDLTDEKWRDRQERDRHIDHVIKTIEKWTLKHKASELEEKGQLMHFPWAMVVGVEHG